MLVVHLIDSFTGGPPLGPQLSVRVEGILQKPLVKPNGMFVFPQVPQGRYRVTVQAGLYFSETLEVSTAELNPLHPVVLVPLMPQPAYPFREGATLVRAALRDQAGRPLDRVKILGVVVSESCAKAKISGDGTGTGAQEIALYRVVGKLRAGDLYFLRNGSGEGEICRIADAVEGRRTFPLAAPLEQAHPVGTSLQPCVETWSDPRGEVVLAFGNCRAAAFDVQIRFFHQGNIVVREVRVEEGTSTNLGSVSLDQVVG
ncbi:MAG: hypothetical protein WCC10_15280 [Tumebacillaceae bacterium]